MIFSFKLRVVTAEESVGSPAFFFFFHRLGSHWCLKGVYGKMNVGLHTVLLPLFLKTAFALPKGINEMDQLTLNLSRN